MTLKNNYLILLFIFSCTYTAGQNMSYKSFGNIDICSGAIGCFYQDSIGLIWVGTQQGLYSYDGYSAHIHHSYDEKTVSYTYCIVQSDNDNLLIGTDDGVLIYNIKTDSYENKNIKFPTDVRTMVLDSDGNTVWIGSLYGLYKYDLTTSSLIKIEKPSLPHQTIYSLILSSDSSVYVGTYNGACRYNKESDDFEMIDLPINQNRSNLFVNTIMEDTLHRCIWFGTSGDLFRYSPSSSEVKRIEQLNGNSIKTLNIDYDNNLLIGTDNGLYIYNDDNKTEHAVHDSGNDRSLSNNIIWNIFKDRDNNIWLATDYGISLCRYNINYQSVPISQLSDINAGNQFYYIFRDSYNNFWYGGTNGLMLQQNNSQNIWYRFGDSKHPISHNRIRFIYEDKDLDIWVATDGCVNRYDKKTKQFHHYNIVDSSLNRNANWVYSIFEDNNSKLWIATCLGGVFMVDKEKLLLSSGYHIAEKNFSVDNGLSGDFVNRVIPDRQGNVWVLLYNKGINKINTDDYSIDVIPLDIKAEDENPTYILCDNQGYIWAGARNRIWRINPVDYSMKVINFDDYNNKVSSMVEENDNIWINTTHDIFIVNKSDMAIKRLNITNQTFTCSFFDKHTGNVYMGGVDKYAIFSPNILTKLESYQPIVISALYANDIPMKAGIDYEGKSVRYLDNITLPYDKNSLRFEFSDLGFSTEEKTTFIYMLDGVDEYWKTTPQNDNSISYHNLRYGTYTFKISKPNAIIGKPAEFKSFIIHINPPWYYTAFAKFIYIILIVATIIWIINYYVVKSRLRIERIQQEKTMELSNMKINFFTDVSHEFKTPLSMIIAPVSHMLQHASTPEQKRDLNIIQHNAFRLNSLISQILEFNRMDNGNNSLSPIVVDFVPFAGSVFSFFCEIKDFKFSFYTNYQSCDISIDVLKMESVLNNILSNACKFSNKGEEIKMIIDVDETKSILNVSVSNYGIGIPNDELPYVFERFYQSKNNNKKNEGSGIGLYLAKCYVELHGGKINISSKVYGETIVSFALPLPPQSEKKSVEETPAVNLFDDISKVLIVEDNQGISSFIHKILSPKHQCFIAENGKMGLEMCLQIMPDIIIADIRMPVMDGLTMCKQIKKHIPTSTIPIIMLTAKDDIQTERESIHLNIEVFMPKPFDVEILTARVEQLLLSKRKLEHKLRLETLSEPAKDSGIMSYEEKFLSNITHLIEDNISNTDLNVSLLSEMADISAKQLYRKIKQLTGKTPVEYIRSIRMKKAAILLSNGTFSIAEVMYLVGFSSPSYFSKCFQTEFGKAPKEWK